MQTFRTFFLAAASLLTFSLPALANTDLDTQYGFRTVGVAVLKTSSNPIFASQVQRSIEAEVAALPRFELRGDLSESLIAETQSIESLEGFAAVGWVKPLNVLSTNATQAGVFANIAPGLEGRPVLQLALVASDGTVIHRSESAIDDPKSVPSFVGTSRRMVREMASALPFDATVLSRDGYRLVIDHGLPELYSGLKLAAFTIEKQNGRLALVETGRIQVSRSESRIAFAQVLVEKKPLQISAGNKVRFEPLKETDSFVSLLPTPKRGLSSLGGEFVESEDASDESFTQSAASFSRLTHGRYGSLNVDFVGALVTWNRTGVSSSQVGSDSSFYPGVELGGELWITRNWLVEAGFQLALSGLNAPAGSGASSLNSQLNQMQLLGGYRFRLVNAEMTPMLTLKAGLSRTQYKVDTATAPLAAMAGTYSGFMMGADLSVPLSDKFGMALTTGFLALPSYTQTPAISTESVSGWQFGISSYYFWTQTLQLEAALSFQAHSVDFTTTAANSTSSASQNQRRFSLGAKYFF